MRRIKASASKDSRSAVHGAMLRSQCAWLLGACALACPLLPLAGASADEGALPPLQHAGEIRYLSGGIGADESGAMKAAAGNYALALTFTARVGKRDAYTTDVQLTIAKADGTALLQLKSAGPFLLADLPAGDYRIAAMSGEVSKTSQVRIAAGAQRRLVFEWIYAGEAGG